MISSSSIDFARYPESLTILLPIEYDLILEGLATRQYLPDMPETCEPRERSGPGPHGDERLAELRIVLHAHKSAIIAGAFEV